MDFEKGIVIADGVGKTVKEMTELFPETTGTLDKKVKEKLNPPSKLEKIEKKVGSVKSTTPGLFKAAENNAITIMDTFGEELNEWIKDQLSKTHGSKVKVGKYAECPIVEAGTKSVIIDTANENEIIYLTPEYVKCCRYVKEKFKLRKMKNDYYYEITFVDGSECYIRVSEKHKKNLDNLVEMTNCFE